jgi:dTDP-4-dehydrorhamnose reductase
MNSQNKKVLLLGATGMLGSAVYGVLKGKYDLILGVRNLNKVALLERAYGNTGEHVVVPFDAAALYQEYLCKKAYPGAYLSSFLEKIGNVDFVVNAIGVTIPFSLCDPSLTLFINGALPHILVRTFGDRLIHITTDCVYSGMEGFPYDENSPKSPTDIYGLSKSLGEPAECLTIRTSIIGRELDGFTGLLEWFRQQEKKRIIGFVNHRWNGITTKQFGELCDQIMQEPARLMRPGVFHVFSTSVSKYEMLLTFQQKFGIDCTIVPDMNQRLDRTLTTLKDLNDVLQVPSFIEMLNSLDRFQNEN